ncbi:hypothetical protein VTI74DRAFT_9471 [Chaetomium olivicolor]
MVHIASCLVDADEDDFSIGLNNCIAKAVTEPKGEKDKRTAASGGLRNRTEEHNYIPRRKISVPELGPMTIVQEVSVDSPTIPGRPPIDERSITALGSSWKPYYVSECTARSQTLDASFKFGSAYRSNEELERPIRQPLLPKRLTPVVTPISNSTSPPLARQMSPSQLRSGNTPVEPLMRSARTKDSPRVSTRFTSLSASLITPRSAGTVVTLPTPVSAPIDHRASPTLWDKPTNCPLVGGPKESTCEASGTPKMAVNEPIQSVRIDHRRHQSESTSVKERRRPRKRSEACGTVTLKKQAQKRSKGSERRTFEQLPKGWKTSDAVNMLSLQEVASLQKQALQQAPRFEVLRKEDVDSLSRELRQLDERCEYLRRTYTSLRAGKRNLHIRICQYLRSPRTAKFSREAMLKQEAALVDLDTSIDEWVNKLEQAEDRCTRIRQKLLEHIAAAVTLTMPTADIVGVSASGLSDCGIAFEDRNSSVHLLCHNFGKPGPRAFRFSSAS